MKLIVNERTPISFSVGITYTLDTIYNPSLVRQVVLDGAVVSDFRVGIASNSIEFDISGFTPTSDTTILCTYETLDSVSNIGQYIVNEEPINISPNIYKLTNIVGAVDNVYVDGEIYTAYKVSENKLILEDIPDFNIIVNYWSKTCLQDDLSRLVRVSKESPEGKIVKSKNIGFLLAQEPYQVENVYLDGALFFDYWVDGRSIIMNIGAFNDIEFSVQVDYYYEPVNAPKPLFTLGKLIDKVKSYLGSSSNSVNFSDEQLTLEINQLISQIARGRVVGHLGQQGNNTIAGDPWFMEGTEVINVQPNIYLSKDLVPGDIIIYCSTQGLKSSGYLHLGMNGDIVKYTQIRYEYKLDENKNIISFNSVGFVLESPITSTYKGGTKLYPLYELLEEVDKIIEVTNGASPVSFWDIILFDEKKLLKIGALGSIEYRFNIKYLKKNKMLELPTDASLIPDDFVYSIVPPIVAGTIGLERGYQMASQWLKNGYDNLIGLYNYGNTPKVRTEKGYVHKWKFKSIRSII